MTPQDAPGTPADPAPHPNGAQGHAGPQRQPRGTPAGSPDTHTPPLTSTQRRILNYLAILNGDPFQDAGSWPSELKALEHLQERRLARRVGLHTWVITLAGLNAARALEGATS